MNYKKHYEYLCSSRKLLDRTRKDGIYYEKHHIVPKCLGGSNNYDNLVLLTPREHYIAHLLLFFMHKEEGGLTFRKMAFALVSMASKTSKLKREPLNSRIYSIIREAAILSRLGHKVKNTKNYTKPKSEAHREAIRKARLEAPPRSKETRDKQRALALSRTTNLPDNYIKDTCPYCNKKGQKNAMKRWHFKNCKKRKEEINA